MRPNGYDKTKGSAEKTGHKTELAFFYPIWVKAFHNEFTHSLTHKQVLILNTEMLRQTGKVGRLSA